MKKRKALKENQIDLKHGFVLELVKHPVGDANGSLEGFLTYIDKEIDIDNKRFYSEPTEAIRDFDNRIIPEFIGKNNNIKVFKYLKDDAMFDFVKKYLTEKQLTYGMVIDVIKVLEEDGYAIPNNKDKTQVGNLIEFYLCVDRLSAEFKKHLKHFGFIADRNVNNTIDHPRFIKHEKCKNIVFTRYPWTNGFKAISIINDFISITENDLSFNTDIDIFKKVSKDAHKYLKDMLSVFNKVNLKTKDTLEDINYEEIKNEFREYFKENKQTLVDIWSKRRPVNYGVYTDS